jgi:CDP-glycerol glycerophosphotransferase
MKVVYNSFSGRFSDNPRALFHHLQATVPGSEHCWLVDRRHAAGFPAGTDMVAIDSPEAIRTLESADLVIANTHIELDWVKKPGARYLQTWHGTPLKRVHYDVFWAPAGRLDELDFDVARWDYLLSPNTVSTSRLQRAFGFTGAMLETGYPRNDVLASSRGARVRERVRADLGLDDDVTAVLYTPTWRDDEFYDLGRDIALALDVQQFADQLGPKYRLLTRLHYMVTERSAALDRAGVIDVSRYPDVQELYLAADAMITDYSSTMFDFAVTGKPLIFYTYDLPRYRDSLRGFYFDFEPVAPGPMVTTTQEVIDAFRHLPDVTAEYAGRYAHFRQLFCHLDDARASERVVRALLGAAPAVSTQHPRVKPAAGVVGHS